MRFSVGIMDALFGEKVEIEVPGSRGKPVKRAVTKKWLEKMQREGRAKRIETPTRVHMLHPSKGYTVEEWVIEKEQEAAPFRDKVNGDLYAITVFEDGKPKITLLFKEEWEEARQLIDSM